MSVGFSIDVEEFFHAENMKALCPQHSWDQQAKQLPGVIESLITRLDALSIRATFFVLGWSARKHPEMVRLISEAGHEVASHGMSHARLTTLTPAQIRQEVKDSKNLLEDLSGTEVKGFRAPSFSITDTAIDILQDCGYQYDSSYHPFRSHTNYGRLNELGVEVAPNLHEIRDGFFELALPVSRFHRFELPIGGGAYFRFLPQPVYHWLTQSWLKSGKDLIFYTHPWELKQPSIPAGLPFLRQLRQLHNVENGLARTCHWLEAIQASGHQFATCSQIIKSSKTTEYASAS